MSLALMAALFVGACADEQVSNDLQGALRIDFDAAAAAVGEVQSEAEEMVEPHDAPTDDIIDVAVSAWPFHLDVTRIDAVAVRGDSAYVAAPVRQPEQGTRLEIHRVDGDARQTSDWATTSDNPSPLALATSDDAVLAAWSHGGEGAGRVLSAVILVGDGLGEMALDLVPEGPFEPFSRPLVAQRSDGWLVCSRSSAGAPRCAAITPDGDATWHTIRSLKSYPLWKLIPVEGGYALLAGSCEPERCLRPRIVLQYLSPTGSARGAFRRLVRLQAHRGLGAFQVPGGVLLFGKRPGAKHGAAFLVHRKGVDELVGRWSRLAGGAMVDGDGALLIERGTLTMDLGRPTRRTLPQRWRPDRQVKKRERAAWPSEIDALVPRHMDLNVLSDNGVVAVATPRTSGAVQGVILRPDGPRPATPAEP